MLRPTLKCDAEREGLKQNLIEEGVGLHQKGDLEGAAKVYSRLLKVSIVFIEIVVDSEDH